MTQKHTQGPWITDKATIRTQAAPGWLIATIENAIARDANARLIAAAPEILGALEQLVSLFPCFPASSDERKALELAQEAIAKATGQEEKETAQ